MVILYKFTGNSNTFDNPSGRIYVLNKAGDINLNVFIMITRINWSRTFMKHIYLIVNLNLRVKNLIQIKSGRNISVSMSLKIQLNIENSRNITLGS